MMENPKVIQKEQRSGKKYAELLCDFMFKRMFGTDANKDILIDFLNIILEDVEVYYTTYPIAKQGREAKDGYQS